MGARYHIAANQDWTGDLTLTMGALYLLSYRGNGIIVAICFKNANQKKLHSQTIFLR